MKTGLPRATNSRTTVLILGSFPSEQSLQKKQYYANPGNDFWGLISKTVGVDISDVDYKTRIRTLQSHGIGLWDVIGKCERGGSADANIRNPRLNNFSVLKRTCPRLRLVCFNGKKAGASEPIFRQLGYATKVLPSSSAANRRYAAKRRRIWRSILKR